MFHSYLPVGFCVRIRQCGIFHSEHFFPSLLRNNATLRPPKPWKKDGILVSEGRFGRPCVALIRSTRALCSRKMRQRDSIEIPNAIILVYVQDSSTLCKISRRAPAARGKNAASITGVVTFRVLIRGWYIGRIMYGFVESSICKGLK